MDAAAIAQLPFVAFLIVVGGGIFTLLATGKLRWDREVTTVERSEVEWKQTAITATTTAAQQATQITKLTEIVETLTQAVANRGGV